MFVDKHVITDKWFCYSVVLNNYEREMLFLEHGRTVLMVNMEQQFGIDSSGNLKIAREITFFYESFFIIALKLVPLLFIVLR